MNSIVEWICYIELELTSDQSVKIVNEKWLYSKLYNKSKQKAQLNCCDVVEALMHCTFTYGSKDKNIKISAKKSISMSLTKKRIFYYLTGCQQNQKKKPQNLILRI